MRIVSSDSLKITNPKCKINTQMVNDGSNPVIEIAFCMSFFFINGFSFPIDYLLLK